MENQKSVFLIGFVMLHQIITTFLDSIFPVATVLVLPALFVFSYFVDKREYGKADEERIYEIAKFNRCSEYHVFTVAGVNWNIAKAKIEYDFDLYLNNGAVPFYVRDFIRTPIPEL